MPRIGNRGINLEQGEYFTLKPSGLVDGAVVNAVGTPFVLKGERRIIILLLDITQSATAAGDTLDVYVDVLGSDGVTWINAVHFTQQAGNGAAKKWWAMQSIAAAPAAVCVAVATDAASGVTRPYLVSDSIRARWTTVEATDVSHTFSVTGYAI
jgi:hypothetical protein